MATKKEPGGDKGYAPFVSCELNDDEREYVKAHLLTGVKILELLSGLVEEGYRTSLAYDMRNDAVSIIVTGVGDSCPNKDLAMSGRGPTVQGAVSVFAYKHIEKLHGEWPRVGPNRKRDAWG